MFVFIPYDTTLHYLLPNIGGQCINIAAVAKRNKLPVARFSSTNDQVDYCGIGVDVKSFRPDGKFQKMDGTSMATPHVCSFLTALLSKGGKYEDRITDDKSCRKLIIKNSALMLVQRAVTMPLVLDS